MFPTQQPQPFGQASSSAAPFGASTSTGMFGQPQQQQQGQQGGGIFGGQTGGGMFGQPQQQPQQQQQQQPGLFSNTMFSQPPAQSAPNPLFPSSQPAQQPQQSLFGSSSQPPAQPTQPGQPAPWTPLPFIASEVPFSQRHDQHEVLERMSNVEKLGFVQAELLGNINRTTYSYRMVIIDPPRELGNIGHTLDPPSEQMPESLWMEAQARNPDKTMFVPVLLKGVDGLQKKIERQKLEATMNIQRTQVLQSDLSQLYTLSTSTLPARLSLLSTAQSTLNSRSQLLHAKLLAMKSFQNASLTAVDEEAIRAAEECQRIEGGLGARVRSAGVVVGNMRGRRGTGGGEVLGVEQQELVGNVLGQQQSEINATVNVLKDVEFLASELPAWQKEMSG